MMNKVVTPATMEWMTDLSTCDVIIDLVGHSTAGVASKKILLCEFSLPITSVCLGTESHTQVSCPYHIAGNY